MKNKNLWFASLGGAAVSLLLANLPFVNFINCLLCVGFWGSAVFATWLYRRLNGSLTVRESVKAGLLSGAIAGVVGFLLSFVGLAGLQGIMNGAQSFLPADALGSTQDIPAWGMGIANLVGMMMEIGFGALGGWLGGALFRTDRQPAVRADLA